MVDHKAEKIAAKRELVAMCERFKQAMLYTQTATFLQKNELSENAHPITISFDIPQLRPSEIVPYLNDGAITNGAFHDTLLRSALDIITKHSNTPLQSLIGVYGGTAAGKTGLMSALFFMLPVVTYLTTGLRQIPILCLASNTEVRSWFHLDIETRSILLRAINITYKDETVNVYDFWHGDVFGFRANDRWYEKYVMMRENHGTTAFTHENNVLKVKEIADTYLLLVDEVQHGAKSDSLLDKILDSLSATFGGINRGRQIFFSATPSALWAGYRYFPTIMMSWVEMWVVGRMYLGPRGFLGLAMWDIETGKKATTRIWQIEAYSFLNLQWDEDENNRWWKYRDKRWKSRVNDFTRSIVDRAMDRDCSVLVKLARRNNQADDYTNVMWATIESMGPSVLSKFVLVLNYSTKLIVKDAAGTIEYDRSEISTRVLVEQLRSQGKIPIITVVGRSKWGDQYPNDTIFFVDLTKEPTSWQTYIQGVPGRASGYGKESILILCPNGKHKLESWIANDGVDIDNVMPIAHDVTTIDSSYHKTSGSLRLTFRHTDNLDDLNPSVSTLVHEYGRERNRIFNLCNSFKMPFGKDQFHPRYGSRNQLLHDLDTKYLPLITQQTGISLALPGEIVPHKTKNGGVREIKMAAGTEQIFPRLDVNNAVWMGTADAPGTRGSNHRYGVQDALAYHSTICPTCGSNTAHVMNSLLMKLSRKDAYTATLLNTRRRILKREGLAKITRAAVANLCCASHAKVSVFESQLPRIPTRPTEHTQRRERTLDNIRPKESVMELHPRPRNVAA